MKKLYLISLPLLLSLKAVAQSTVFLPVEQGHISTNEFNKIHKEPLLIVLPEAITDAETLRSYAKHPEQLKFAQADIVARRAALEQAAKFWTISKEVKFITEANLDKLREDHTSSHLILKFGTLNIPNGYDAPFLVPALMLYLVGKGEKQSLGTTLIKAYTGNSRLAASQIFYSSRDSFWYQTYHLSDYISTIQQMQSYIAHKVKGEKDKDIEKEIAEQLGKNAPFLKTKTLLLARERISAKLPEDKISKIYPYPFQVADQAAIEAAVAGSDSRYLYIRYVGITRDHGYQLIDAATGQVVSYANNYHLLDDSELGNVQESHLKEIVKIATKKSK